MVAVGLVLTYQATGVFNFAFGAQAYTSAFVFTWLVQNEHFPIWLAFVLSVVILAPVLGLVFDRYLFRKIPNSNTTAKLVTGISLFVGIPALLPVHLRRARTIYNPPSILFNPERRVLPRRRYAVQRDLPELGGGPPRWSWSPWSILMRFTNLGLQMRGAVESRRLVQLDGVNAGRVVAIAWAISSLMAGLAGVLLAPAQRPAPGPGLRHADGGRLRRRRLGGPAFHAHRRPGRRFSSGSPTPSSRAICRRAASGRRRRLDLVALRRARWPPC